VDTLAQVALPSLQSVMAAAPRFWWHMQSVRGAGPRHLPGTRPLPVATLMFMERAPGNFPTPGTSWGLAPRDLPGPASDVLAPSQDRCPTTLGMVLVNVPLRTVAGLAWILIGRNSGEVALLLSSTATTPRPSAGATGALVPPTSV